MGFQTLFQAIKITFATRNYQIPDAILVFTNEFAKVKQVQWKAFRSRSGSQTTPEQFLEVLTSINSFLTPISKAIFKNELIIGMWNPQGPWIFRDVYQTPSS